MLRRKTRRQVLEKLENRTLLAGDLVAHWHAQDLAATVGDREVVALWQDNISAIVSMSDGAPFLDVDALNGRPGVVFDGEGIEKDLFTVPKEDNPISNAADFSIAVAFTLDPDATRAAGENWHDGTGVVHANRLGFAKDYGVTVHGDGVASAGIGGGFGQPSVSAFGTTIGDRSPHVVVMTRSAGTVSLFVDAEDPVITIGAESGPRDSAELWFGESTRLPGAFQGIIGEVRIYDGALSAAEAQSEITSITSYYDNSPPVPSEDRYGMDEDTVLLVSKNEGVLSNDVDVDDDLLTATLVTQPQHGNLSLNTDGSFIYDPDRNYHGIDQFTYTANDFRPSTPSTVTIEIRPKRDAPFPLPDTYQVRPDATLSVPEIVGVLSNDLNQDNLPIEALLTAEPNFGELQLFPNGGFEFNPMGASGTAVFRYRIVDGQNTTSDTSVSIIVNAEPIATPDTYQVAEDTTLAVNALNGVVANDFDPDDDNLVAELVREVQHGTLALADDGAFVYTPGLDFFGEDTFTYRISDGTVSSLPVDVQLTVASQNDAPIAQPNSYFVAADETLQIAAVRGVLRNDVDVDHTTNELEAKLVTAPDHGTLSLASDGGFNYRPNVGFSGTDQFTYEAVDPLGGKASGVVTLFVGDSPIVINEIMAVNVESLLTRVRDEPDGRFRGDRLSPDWVELYNQSDSPIDISGFHLTDSKQNPTAWAFPEGSVIPAKGFHIVFLDRLNIVDAVFDESEILHASFKLDANGDYLAVTDPGGIVLDELEDYPPQFGDISYARTANGFVYQTESSPGQTNHETGLSSAVETPESSVPAGYYAEEIEVRLTSSSPGAVIRYTTDASEPTETNGDVYSDPIRISATTMLRIRAFSEGEIPSRSKTYSYIYLDSVADQSAEPEGFPETWQRAGASDYAVDPRVTTDTESPYFSPRFREALQSHDAISIVTDMEHLFDRNDGIYVNPQRDGVAWERPASMELISSSGEVQLQLNAGLRIQGGASRNPNRPKHNMRLLFKEQYGQSDLDYALFEDSAVRNINTLIFRGGNGDSWFHPNSTQQRQAQYIRDQWHKKTQQLMGHTFVPQRYIHLYMNGLYWGLYHTFEKPNAAFFAERFGGQPEEYDVLQHQNGIVDGNRDKWRDLLAFVREAPESDATLDHVQQEVDLPAFMEYLLLNFYSGNVDWDQNNWFGGRRREDGKFIFFTWDAERTFLNARDNRTTATNPGQPTDLHRRLYRENAEYRLMFADAAHKLFFNDGLLTPEKAAGRWHDLADEIELPLIAESARWGDSKRRTRPYTVEGEWRGELNRLLNTYFPDRTDTVVAQLNRLDLYPDVAAPAFNQHGGVFETPFQLTMAAPEGVVYYSMDGSDVRLPGGEISPSARAYSEPIGLTDDSLVKSRTLLNGEWSALNEAQFLLPSVNASSANLRVTELQFNPGTTTAEERLLGFDDNDDFEFVELLNIGDNPIDLTDVAFREVDGDGIDFDFRLSPIKRLRPGETALVVEDQHAFRQRFGDGLPVAGEWQGRLSNGGETISLFAGEQLIQDFTYDDAWHADTDGNGLSLQVVDPREADLAAWSDAAGWVAREESPGFNSPANIPGDSNRDGVFDSSDLVFVFQAAEYEDDVQNNSTFEEGDWNGDGDFTSSDFVFAFREGTYVRNLLVSDVDVAGLLGFDNNQAGRRERARSANRQR